MKKTGNGSRKNLPVGHLLFLLILPYLIACPLAAEGPQPAADTVCFSLKSIDGENISLKDFRDKKVVHLLFWATWCPHCLMEMPKIKELHQSISSKSYEILAIDVGLNDTLPRIKKIQNQYHIPCKILLDENGEVTRKYGIIGVPYHIIIGKDGTILDRFNELPEDHVKRIKKLIPPDDGLNNSSQSQPVEQVSP